MKKTDVAGILEHAADTVARTRATNGYGAAGQGAINKLRTDAASHRRTVEDWLARGATPTQAAAAVAERITGNKTAAPRDMAPPAGTIHCEECAQHLSPDSTCPLRTPGDDCAMSSSPALKQDAR